MYGVASLHYPAPRRGAGQKVLYLDFDGPLHHHEVYWYPKRGPVLKAAPPHRLFQHAELLVAALAPYDDVKIVLSTSWVKFYGFRRTVAKLPAELRHRAIGATFHRGMSRHEFDAMSRGMQILQDVARRAPKAWVALDDDVEDWPREAVGNLIAVDEVLGLSVPNTMDALKRRLESWRHLNPSVASVIYDGIAEVPGGQDDNA